MYKSDVFSGEELEELSQRIENEGLGQHLDKDILELTSDNYVGQDTIDRLKYLKDLLASDHTPVCDIFKLIRKNNNFVLGITGPARSGKDTTVDIIKELLKDEPINIITYTFAKPLKEASFKYLDVNTIEEVDYYKNNNIKRNGLNVRKLLQQIADGFRAEDEYFFVNILTDKVNSNFDTSRTLHVVTDVRMFIEDSTLDMLYGDKYTLIRLNRPDVGIEESNHNSETAIFSLNATYDICNDEDIEALESKVHKTIEDIEWFKK